MSTTEKPKFHEVMDNVDLARAERLRAEYGRVKWVVSWYKQEDGYWLARLSAPKVDDTIEALGQSRCLAIDSATRQILDVLHRIASGETFCSKCHRPFGNESGWKDSYGNDD